MFYCASDVKYTDFLEGDMLDEKERNDYDKEIKHSIDEVFKKGREREKSNDAKDNIKTSLNKASKLL